MPPIESNDQLPRYRCHKEVRAAKIEQITQEGTARLLEVRDAQGNRGRVLVLEAWVARHEPQVGGYYVVYDDGYTSYSPAEAFEAGYTLISTERETLQQARAYHKHQGGQ